MDRKKEKSIFKGPLVAILITVLIAAVYLHASLHLEPLKVARLKFSDFFFRWRHNYNTAAGANITPGDVVLITIDEESYKRLEKRWPWGRDVFADFLDKLRKYDPKVIALDFALYGESPDDPAADEKLAKAIERCGNVIVASVYGKERLYLGPYDIFAKASAGYGVIGAVRDIDSSIRRLKIFALILASQKGGDISFEVKTAASYLDADYDRVYQDDGHVILKSARGDIKIPVDENGHIVINYKSDAEDVTTIPIWKIIEGDVPEGILEGKLALVSQTGEIFHDVHLTPIGYRPGGLIIANVLNSIIRSDYIGRIEPELSWGVLAILYILCFVLFYKSRYIYGLFELLAILAFFTAVSFFLFLDNIVLPAFDALALLPSLFLGVIFYKYTMVLFESAEIKLMAITDSMTSLYTHRYFRFLLEHEVGQGANFGFKNSMIMIRILNLERIIKEISFNKGQMVQRRIAALVKAKVIRKGSAALLCMGEFGMLLPKIGLPEALGIAGSLRDNIREEDFGISEESLKPAVAVGVATTNNTEFPKTGADLMRSAKAAMSRAREIGHDKICRFNPKIDTSVFEPTIVEKEIRQRLDDELGFLATDLEERNKELEDLLRQLSLAHRDLEQAHFDTLRALVVALEEKDPCSAGHSERVGRYVEKIGRKFNMSEEELLSLRRAGILHDIGKVGVPQDILRKETGLNESERHIIELHPEFSVRILNTSKYFSKLLHAIRDHHERLDGSGYPRGLKGEQISFEAQIMAVIDVFDALSTDRPYRKAFTHKEAIKELSSHPEKYNQKVVLALKRILEEEHSLSHAH